MRLNVVIGSLVLVSLAGPVGLASVTISVDCAPDDLNARVSIWAQDQNKAEISAAREKHWTFCEALRSLEEGAFEALFGKPSEKIPPDYAIPVFTHSAVGFSGLGYKGNHQSRFYPIADIGGVLMFPYGDGKSVSAVLIYLKIDSKFTPVRSIGDYRARMNWDTAKLKLLEAWVENRARQKKMRLQRKRL